MEQKELLESLRGLTESGTIQNAEQNLRNKLGSLIRSIENLTQKRARIDYELKRQKQSLARKRLELKKDSKHLKAKKIAALQERAIFLTAPEQILRLNRIDDSLLRESARILDES